MAGANRRKRVQRASKPPLGITPLWRWQEFRLAEICGGVQRFEDAKTEIPTAWLEEMGVLTERLLMYRKTGVPKA